MRIRVITPVVCKGSPAIIIFITGESGEYRFGRSFAFNGKHIRRLFSVRIYSNCFYKYTYSVGIVGYSYRIRLPCSNGVLRPMRHSTTARATTFLYTQGFFAFILKRNKYVPLPSCSNVPKSCSLVWKFITGAFGSSFAGVGAAFPAGMPDACPKQKTEGITNKTKV